MRRKRTNVKVGTFAIFTYTPLGFLREEFVSDVGKEFFDECEGVLFELIDVPVGVMVLTTEGLEGFGGCGFATFCHRGHRFTACENVSYEAFDREVGEGSPHGSEVTGWLHSDLEAVEEILGDDGGGFVVNDVKVSVDLREHVDDAGPFNVDGERKCASCNMSFLLFRIIGQSANTPRAKHPYR